MHGVSLARVVLTLVKWLTASRPAQHIFLTGERCLGITTTFSWLLCVLDSITTAVLVCLDGTPRMSLNLNISFFKPAPLYVYFRANILYPVDLRMLKWNTSLTGYLNLPLIAVILRFRELRSLSRYVRRRGTRLKIVGYSTSVGKSMAHTRGEVRNTLNFVISTFIRMLYGWWADETDMGPR